MKGSNEESLVLVNSVDALFDFLKASSFIETYHDLLTSDRTLMKVEAATVKSHMLNTSCNIVNSSEEDKKKIFKNLENSNS